MAKKSHISGITCCQVALLLRLRTSWPCLSPKDRPGDAGQSIEFGVPGKAVSNWSSDSSPSVHSEIESVVALGPVVGPFLVSVECAVPQMKQSRPWSGSWQAPAHVPTETLC